MLPNVGLWPDALFVALVLLPLTFAVPWLTLPLAPERGVIAIGQFACGLVCISQFGIGLVTVSQFAIAGYALAQFAAAYSLIAQFGVYVAQGRGQFVLRVSEVLARAGVFRQ